MTLLEFAPAAGEVSGGRKEKYTILEARARNLVCDTGMDFADAFGQIKFDLTKFPN